LDLKFDKQSTQKAFMRIAYQQSNPSIEGLQHEQQLTKLLLPCFDPNEWCTKWFPRQGEGGGWG
jgi:hypothetical protein